MSESGGLSGELAKRVLKWLRHHSNTVAITALKVPTMKYRMLVRKLGFLHRVTVSNPVSLLVFSVKLIVRYIHIVRRKGLMTLNGNAYVRHRKSQRSS